MRVVILGLAAATFGAIGSPAAASIQSATSPSSAATSGAGPDSREKLLSDYTSAMFDHRYDQALRSLDEIKVDSGNRNGRALLDAMRASAMLGLRRRAEADKLIAEAEQLAPDMPEPSSILLLGGLVTENIDIAADSLDRLIARFPDVVRELDWEQVRYLLQKEPKGQERGNEDRRIALARLGFGGDSERGHSMADNGVHLLVKRGDMSGAAELLPYVKEPDMLEDMLIQKRFAPLWPRVEQLAGPHLDTVRAASIGSARKIYDANPDDPEAAQNLVNALRHAGRYDDAIALGSSLPKTSEEMAKVGEQTGWLVNNVAFALFEAGRADEADRLFALLNEASVTDGKWRVSMKINRLELLVLGGEFARALPLLDLAEDSAKNEGSPYARQLVRRLKYCTYIRTGHRPMRRRSKATSLSMPRTRPTQQSMHCFVRAMWTRLKPSR